MFHHQYYVIIYTDSKSNKKQRSPYNGRTGKEFNQS
nr:MAG TPA: hypothetical protein [Caudoviricetes sp.]DAK70664.1 MAG TPA: hypothetical protein [Caudoviricetes sp.]DAR48171.1 MAG TPA: hypothetical protein [Caudoviricetes sp.]